MKNITDNPSLNDELKIKNKFSNDRSHITGWAIDADLKNDPTYSMRQRINEETKNYDWKRPSLQVETTEILHSTERPNLTAVFGTSTPPSGISGMIRRFAFRYSEGKMAHWLALLLADRVNVIEGLVTDVAKGYVPNILTERGIRAEWKHNPQAVAVKAVIGLAVVTSFVLILKKQK